MAKGLNKVMLIGNLGKDPELRSTRGGTSVCNMRLACTERRKEGDDYKDHTEWVDVVCFGKTAENAAKYLKKGRQVFVEGRLQTDEYKDKDGNKRWRTQVVSFEVMFIGGDGQQRSTSSASSSRPARETEHVDDAPPAEVYDDELPF
jgi:single-strand DNA-binding protein